MNFSKISEWSIRNPIPTLLLFLVLSLWGLNAYGKLRINSFPDIEAPIVVVTVVQSGAAPAELETQVTRYVENALSGLQGVKHISSTVVDGASTTVIEFQLGVNVDRATNDVRNAVTSVRAQLPSDIQDPTVQRVDIAGGSLVTWVVRAPGMTPEQRSWYVDNELSKKLMGIPGLSQVSRDGGVTREIRVKLDPARLSAFGVTAAEVSNALRSQNINLAGGRANVGSQEQTIRTLGAAVSVAELAETRVPLSGGRSVKLRDLGEVADEWTEPRGRARYDGEEVVAFSIFRSPGASDVTVARQAREVIKAINSSRKDLKIDEVQSNERRVLSSFHASTEALVIGAALAVLVVWLFLRDIRATVISAVAMPLSLLPTFGMMQAFGESFNVVSLLALSLTVGILVDDAIVEIENIVRHIRQGKKPFPAALEAADEIGLAVVATTATIVAVFAPVGFMPGIVGQFFKSFAFAACVSVLFSLLVARTLTPLLGAYFMRSNPGKEHDEPSWMKPYLAALKWSLRHKFVVLVIGVGFFIGSIMMAGALPSDFVPVEDTAVSTLTVELQPGSTLEQTDSLAQAVTQKLRADSNVTGVYVSIGSGVSSQQGSASSGAEVRRAVFTINLTPREGRKLSQQELEKQWSAAFKNEIPGVQLRFGLGGNGSQADLIFVGDDGDQVTAATEKLMTEMRGLSSIANVSSTAALRRPELIVRPKPDKASQLGVSSQVLSQTLRVATIGDVDQILPKYNLADRQAPIRLMLKESARADLGAIENLNVPTTSGPVPLWSVADVTFSDGPIQIERFERQRSVTVTVELAGVPLGQALNDIHHLPAYLNLPKGVVERISGNVENQSELGVGFGMAILTGIMFMYVVLVLLFKSFAHPLTILTALPLSFGGAFLLLLILHKSLSMPVLIGIIMLMGIAAKNSILLVEYALVSMQSGLSRGEALLEAAHKRARPIIMTTVAMGVGMAPVASGFGENSAFRSPMAIAVIGGLMTSTLLSLLYVPVAFTLIDQAKNFLSKVFGRYFVAEGKADHDSPLQAPPASLASPE